ncbi:MAG: DnaJ C-terminal domain-containing protein [Pseudomonas sp.]
MDFKDYYKILGVDPSADDKTIKAAYRKLARKYHPDVSKEKNAEQHFKEAAEAYDVLKDADKRAEFDDLRKYGQHGRPFEHPYGRQPGAGAFTDAYGGDYSDFFESIFRRNGGAEQARNRSRKGQDVDMELPVFLEETLTGEAKKISFQLPGAMGQPGQSKSLNVKIPIGVADGERIRLKGQGGPGVNGGPAGDLYLNIRFAPHPLFDVQGSDLVLTVPLAPWEAALGTKVEAPTLNGRITLTIPANSQSGQRLRVKGRGLANKAGERGDLYAQLKVVMPKTTSDEVRKLWEKLAQKVEFDPRSEWSK